MGVKNVLDFVEVRNVSKPPVHLPEQDHIDLFPLNALQEFTDGLSFFQFFPGSLPLIGEGSDNTHTMSRGVGLQVFLLGLERISVKGLFGGADTDIACGAKNFGHKISSSM